MSVPEKGSFFSRFAIKFVEIVGAGIATAVGGYLVAHIGALWSPPAPAPAAVQVSPPAAGASASESGRPHAQPAPAVSADANVQRAAPAPANDPAVVQRVRTIVNSEAGSQARRHLLTDTGAAESKASDEESVEAQVRAALAKVDANHPAAPEMPPHQADISPVPPVVAGQSRPAEAPTSGAPLGVVAAAPPAADLMPQPATQAPVQPDPLTTVEIKSRPVVDLGASPAPPPENGQESAQNGDNGLLSAIEKIPDLLRPERPAPAKDPPRPPLPVGD